jgi:xanthine/uracil/vitamin C permease (AzgA family)
MPIKLSPATFSAVGRYFEMKERGATVRKELVGAFATFMSMAYILAVNPRILSDSGGPCVPDPEELGGIFGSEYNSCIEAVKREYITSTAIASMAGCLFMGTYCSMICLLLVPSCRTPSHWGSPFDGPQVSQQTCLLPLPQVWA